ncbi:MAG: hypothetical protein HYU48_00415 [Candidatus Levybacteria bacterium]|nr:hypothetical protein [Candidatus Levybacteria bacterium]
MDNQLAGLNPKLQETYNRVMNTPIQGVPPTQTTSQEQQSSAPLPPPPAQAASPAPSEGQSQVFTPQQPASQTVEVPAKEEIVTVQAPQEPIVDASNSQVFSSKKKAGQISPIVMVVGIVVFLAVYTLVWVKIFGASLPFLP